MLREMCVGELNLTVREYYGRTLFELDIELKGYNRRWEEQWRQIRTPFTLQYNINAEKGKHKKDYQLIPLPSDADRIKKDKAMQKLKQKVAAEQGVKTL